MRILDDVDDFGASELVLLRQGGEIDVGGEWGFGRKGLTPEAQALVEAGSGEVDDGLEAAAEGLVYIALEIGGEDDRAWSRFPAL